MLKEVFRNGDFYSERFAIESDTKRLRKYTYQPTLDGRYIVELGLYSPRADSIIQFIKNRINELARKQESIISVDLFIGKDYPVSLNKNAEIDPHHLGLYENVLRTKSKGQLLERRNGRMYHYEFIFMGRKNTDLYSESVIRIISDRTSELLFMRTELLKFFIIFGITIIIVVILLYRKTRVITDPIKKLVEKVNRISDGHLTGGPDRILEEESGGIKWDEPVYARFRRIEPGQEDPVHPGHVAAFVELQGERLFAVDFGSAQDGKLPAEVVMVM